MEFHLAPLKNISCWAFRAGIPGATDVYTEMFHLKTLKSDPARFWDHFDTYPLPTPAVRQWVQLLSNKPRDIKLLLENLPLFTGDNPAKSQIYGFNLNIGCPDPQILAEGLGAAQITRLDQLKRILDAFLSPDHPYRFSFKVRLGRNNQDVAANSILDLLNLYRSFDDPRLRPIIIHFKHAGQSSSEPPRWEMLEPILDLEMPIIINGGITSPEDLSRIQKKLPRRYLRLWEKHVQGIMIGRGILENPFCFFNFISGAPDYGLKVWGESMGELVEKYPLEERFRKNIEAIIKKQKEYSG